MVKITQSPVICAEGEEGKTGGILQVANLEVLEAVADGYGFLHLGRREADSLIPISAARLPEMNGLGGMEHTVLSSEFKTLDIFKATDGTEVVVQVDVHEVACHFHILIRRTHASYGLHSIGFVQGKIGQALPHRFLLGRVNLGGLVRIDEVVGTDQSAIGNYQ